MVTPGSYWLISAIALCATGNLTEFLPALLERASKQHDIFHAAVLGDAERVNSLLKDDPSLAKLHHEGTKIWTSNEGWTPLTYCISSRVGRDSEKKRKALAQIAQILLDHGADLTGCVDQAIYSNNLEVFEMLLKAGGTCTDDDTLNHAACDGQFDALELLLKYGGKLDRHPRHRSSWRLHPARLHCLVPQHSGNATVSGERSESQQDQEQGR